MATVSAPAAPPASIHHGMRAPAHAGHQRAETAPAGREGRRQHDQDHEARAERDRGGEQSVVEARAELSVDPGLHGGEHAHEARAAEDEPGRNARAFAGAGLHEPTTGLEPVTP